MDEMEKGPQMLTWISSNGFEVLLVLIGNESFFCLEKWHTSQWLFLTTEKPRKCFCRVWSLVVEGWPNLWCQMSKVDEDDIKVAWLTWCYSV